MAIKPEQYKLLRNRYSYLMDNQTSEWRQHWMDLADYILPRHGRFKETRKAEAGKGDKNRHNKILNGSATRAMSVAVAGLKGGLVPHSLPWFKLGLWDEDKAKWGPAKEWLHQCQSIMYSTFSRSNFYSACSTPFTEQIIFGVGPMAVYDDPDKVIHCIPWTIGEYALATDERGLVDTGFRRTDMTVRAAAAKFGKDKLRSITRAKLDTSPDTYIGIINCILPRKDYDPSGGKMADNLPWASLYWEEGCTEQDGLLKESGFHTQPVMFPRWEVIGEDAYGSNCPGMETLADIMMLQKMEADKLLGVETRAKPPMNIPSSFKGRLSTLPSARNIVNATQDSVVRPTLQGVDFDIPAIATEIRSVEMRIKEGFFNDLFLMILNDKNMTATEVARRHEEKLAILGPTLERQNSEFLSPLIDRVWDILIRSSKLPPPPKEIAGQELRIDYVSLLAQAQKAIGTQSIEKVAAFAGNWASINPAIIDKVDDDAMLEEYATLTGINPRVIRSPEATDKVRGAKAQAQQQQQQMEQAEMASKTANNLASAPVGEGNALESLLQQIPAV